jgi:N-acetylneuraminate synthase
VAEFQLDTSREIGDFMSPYVVAELNTSHFGNIETAKEMIRAAKKAGCDCVKFQSWNEESLYSETYYIENPMARRFVRRFSFSSNELRELSDYCREVKIDFASTPYSKDEVDFLVDECQVPFLKVASMDLVNFDLIEHMARTKVPIVLSTGMGSIDEIDKAIDAITRNGNIRICILHCVSLYPTPVSEMNLRNIIGLRERFSSFPIGFSDHSEGSVLAIAATTLGVALIEKHFTLDKSKIGMDNQMAMESDELTEMIQGCNEVFSSLGSITRTVSESELSQRNVMRRSIVSTREVEVGEILNRSDIAFKRPGNGIQINEIDRVIGKKVVQRIENDTVIRPTDIV